MKKKRDQVEEDFSDVFKVLNKNDNKLYALKCIAKDPEEEKNNFINHCKKEIDIMKNIKSKYIENNI